ncbi:MAG: cobyric acid synthase [Pseudomonadota bacterium]
MTHAIMIQGAGTNVGKSMLVAGLCRVARRRGLSVAPFKPQNMSNNAAVTEEGDGTTGEIGRAQALQALACGLPPSVHMNPVLLKPETEIGSQVVVHGRRLTTVRAGEYGRLKPTLMPAVLESFGRLKADADLVIVEGAGSPAEVNLRAGDIANMGFARAAGVPVVLAGDIDRGGVIAQLVGTKAVIDPEDAAMIRAFLVNKFRGDVRLFDGGVAAIEQATGWPSLGTVPWFADAHRLPAEDAMDLASDPRALGHTGVRIAVPVLSRIANFDDLDPLKQTPGVALDMVGPGRALPGDADLVILPGTKSTRGDLAFLRAQGWDIDLLAHHRRGGRILGLCGGYQMLGHTVADPDGIEGPAGTDHGLGLLDVDTVMAPQKRLARAAGRHPASGTAVEGYEIHIGRTEGPACARPLFEIDEATGARAEGAIAPDGRVAGAYLHGVFSADAFRTAYLATLGVPPSAQSHTELVEQTLDALADHLEAALDIDVFLALAR